MAGTIVANTINTDTGLFSTNNAYNGIAKAWVNFAGSTAVINKSFNVSSVTRNSTGNYTVNFATAMADTNYSLVSPPLDTATNPTNGCSMSYNTANTSYATISFGKYSFGYYDPPQVMVAIFD